MKKPVILCVDDDSIVLASLKEQLKNAIDGYAIEIAESGQEALEFVDELIEENGELSLVISDYIMPGLKGDEVLTSIHKSMPNAVKILLTGQAAMDGVTNSVNNANLYRFIEKPWQEEDLLLTISEGIKSYTMERQLERQNKKLEEYNQELIRFTESIVEATVTAIDTRDATTAGHSKRLAEYSVTLAKAINAVDYGKYKNFELTDEQIKELYYSALLHDVGKIGVKESILQKEYRLSNEKQNELKWRFSYVKKCLELKKLKNEITQEEDNTLHEIDDISNFIIEMCKRAYITKDEAERIRSIAKIKYMDQCNDSCNLLNEFEIENLTIPKGNLTEAERKIINSHAEHTYNILRKIPWIKDLEKVPEIAASHHERLDGTGYFRGIKGEELTVQTKILSILDVYEALTALDRPYKPPMSAQKALGIIEEEVNAGKFDKDIYGIFVNEKIYEIFKNVI